MVKVKYDVDKFEWWSKKSPHLNGVGCWKSISSGLGHFKSLVNFELKNESRVLFWYDVWFRDLPFKDQFLDLFRMTRFKDTTLHRSVEYSICTENGRQTSLNRTGRIWSGCWSSATVSSVFGPTPVQTGWTGPRIGLTAQLCFFPRSRTGLTLQATAGLGARSCPWARVACVQPVLVAWSWLMARIDRANFLPSCPVFLSKTGPVRALLNPIHLLT